MSLKRIIKQINGGKTNDLTELIKTVGKEFVNTNNCSYEEINQELCVYFVDEIQDRFLGKFGTLTTSQFVIGEERQQKYLTSKYNDVMLKYGDMNWSKNMLESIKSLSGF